MTNSKSWYLDLFGCPPRERVGVGMGIVLGGMAPVLVGVGGRVFLDRAGVVYQEHLRFVHPEMKNMGVVSYMGVVSIAGVSDSS